MNALLLPDSTQDTLILDIDFVPYFFLINFINIDFKYISTGGINVCSFIVYTLTKVSVHFRGIGAFKCDVIIFETMPLNVMRSYWKE